MGRAILKCHECHQDFPATALVSYAAPRSNKAYNYCPSCLELKQARDAFSDKVCQIFGIKAPGPRIWNERKRLRLQYGYTDNVIIDTLTYLYEVKHLTYKSESIYRITPDTVHEALEYKRQRAEQMQQTTDSFIESIHNQNNIKRKVQIKQSSIELPELNPDDYLEDE